MWESSPFSARLILWSAFGDAALTRPGRTISLGEGNMHPGFTFVISPFTSSRSI